MKSRRDICQGKKTDEVEPTGKELGEPEKELKRDVQEIENYIKGPEKYGPQLGEHRWGFLPIIVQKFLHEVNEDCQISKTNTNLKPNHMCLLRHGVETNAHQSFIACIASAIFYGQFDKKTKKPVEQKKFERTITFDDCLVVWKYDNYKTNTGPYEVEVKYLKKKP
jgi:hypothetical protein